MDSTNPNCAIFQECASCQMKEQDISCFRKIAGVLSEDEIKKHNLVIDPKPAQFSPTVYDLSLGRFHYVYEIGNDGIAKRTAVCIGTASELNQENAIAGDEFEKQTGTANRSLLRIPALGAALIELHEIVDTLSVAKNPSVILITGRFDLKLSLVNRGLVSQQGTQIEPCYKGRLYCFVHNFSSEDIILTRDQKIASIEFSYVSCFCSHDKRKEVRDNLVARNNSRYKEDEYCTPGEGIRNVRYFSSRPDIKLPEACGLLSASVKAVSEAKTAVLQQDVTNRIRDSVVKVVTPKIGEQRRDSRTKIIIALIAMLGPIIVALIAGYFGLIKPMLDENKTLKNDISQYEERFDEMESRIKDLENMMPIDDVSSVDPFNP